MIFNDCKKLTNVYTFDEWEVSYDKGYPIVTKR